MEKDEGIIDSNEMKQYSYKGNCTFGKQKEVVCKGNPKIGVPEIIPLNQSCYSMRSRKKAIYLFCVLVLACVEVSVRDVVVLYKCRGSESCGLTLSKSCLLI